MRGKKEKLRKENVIWREGEKGDDEKDRLAVGFGGEKSRTRK